MRPDFYQNDPALRGYFNTLPIEVRDRILESGVEIATLGELMQCAEHMMRGELS